MSDIVIRFAEEDDLDSIVGLLGEIDHFYGDEMVESTHVRTAQTKAIVANRTTGAPRIIIAMDSAGDTLGFASFSILWPAAGSSTSLYLKELFVQSKKRASGVGRMLVQELFNIAKQQGCTRVEWTTDVANSDAQQFYQAVGFAPSSGKLFYRAEI
ncbi:GNAT family N-acetyltransferase [Actinokineospora sp. NBRC 105648]|uniref:GNAT family N-acetyltransferase n=1 Tax=Actinokineospora sp. NBRC 105648 TaxID=3032206 RepID=UPI0024A39D76|nr:GNAT family N-acetyltransferase [Actinokineospora sp. NBRC 105648]GLZ40196.1 hypothetical protein Acsp05_38200 [Actinokineospora sp. NBRC 105648]